LTTSCEHGGFFFTAQAQVVRVPQADEALVAAPNAFWVVKAMDLGLVAPASLLMGVGLLRGRSWARSPAAERAAGAKPVGGGQVPPGRRSRSHDALVDGVDGQVAVEGTGHW
jgi:hypothetical protein